MWVCEVLGSTAEKLADGAFSDRKVKIALHREAADTETLELGERGVAPLVAVGAERRDAVAVEQRVLIVELRFGDEERVAARGKEILHDDDGVHAAATL